jgi:hypothetical protein
MGRNRFSRTHLPKGAGFGVSDRSKPPVLLDYAEIARFGSRAQRRFAIRVMARASKRGASHDDR